MPRAGIVTFAGAPNVGKSTLLNRILGRKLSITSPKPQTTRTPVVGIRTDEDAQMVILDTPGLLEPQHALHSAMRDAALRALRDADAVVHVVDAVAGDPKPLETLAALTQPLAAPRFVALNKIDAIPALVRQQILGRVPDAIAVSALTGEGVDELLHAIREGLPESPFLYPDDDISTQTLRFFAAELIRETALEQLQDEVPHSIACEVEEFRENRSPVYIRAVLYVERDSQKRILIGTGGTRLREIGKAARRKIEDLVGEKVYLDLWVKILKNWRRNPGVVERFGFGHKQDR